METPASENHSSDTIRSMAEPDPKPSRPRSSRPKRSWRFRLVRAGIVAALLIVVGLITVTQTPALRWIVMGQIEGRLGGEASASSCRVSLGGELVVRDLVLRLPGLEGEAGEYLRADELRAHIEWGSLIGPGNPLTDLVLRGSVLRVSLEEQTSEVNLSMLRPRAGSGVSSGYPRVLLEDVRIELGEHRLATGSAPARYTMLTTLDLEGQMLERPGSDGIYEVLLAQMTGETPDPAGARVSGEIDRDTGSVRLTLTGLDLAEWSSRTAPSRIREFWRALEVRGAIDDATFSYGPGEGLAVRLTPREVDLLIPIPVADENEPSGSRREMLQMRGVQGAIVFAQSGFTAELEGEIEELACRVTLQYDSYSFDASYRAQIETDSFSFDDEGQLKRFAPALMLRVMDRFVDPQAELSGFVRVSRGRGVDGEPGRTSTEGILNISGGSGRFGEYPYPIENISGRVQFDENEVRLLDIRGESATGARLLASGRIWPPRDGAAVDIDIRIRDLKTDELFAESLPDNRRSVYETLFNEREHTLLRERGVLLSSEDRAEALHDRLGVQHRLDEIETDENASPVELESLRDRLAELDAVLARPVMDLGGKGTLDIEIRRALGDDSDYEETITIDIPDAGMVVENFPYPAVAERFRIVIEGGKAVIEPSGLRGIRGGSGSIAGEVAYSRTDYRPDIRIRATGVPIDDLLINALPGREAFERRAATDAPDDSFSVHRFLRRMNLVGQASCEAHIFADEDGDTGYRVDVRFDQVTAHPVAVAQRSDSQLWNDRPGTPSDNQALLTQLSGAFTVTKDLFELRRLEGQIVGQQGQPSPITGTASIALDGNDDRDSVDLVLESGGIDLTAPLERVLDGAETSRAGILAALRDRFAPSGALDATLRLSGTRSDIRYEIEAGRIDRVGFNAFGGRAEIVRPDGSIRVEPGSVTLTGIEGDLRFEQGLAGRLRIGGGYSLDALGAGSGQPLTLEGTVKDALFESALLSAVAGQFSPTLGSRIRELGLAGLYDADFSIISGGETALEAELRPRTLAITRAGNTASFDRASGRIVVTERGGPIELDLASPAIATTVRGQWSRSEVSPFTLDASIEGTASSLHPGVRALLPGAVLDIAAGMEIASDAPLSLSAAQLRLDGDSVRFRGVAGFEALTMRTGLKLENILGRAAIDAELAPGESPQVTVDLTGDRATVSGAQLTQLSSRIETGERFMDEQSGRAADAPGTVYVPSVSGSIAGGRLAARGVLRPEPQSALLSNGPWQVEADLSGVDFGRLLAEVARDPERAARAAENRGVLDANFSLAGRLGDIASQRGRAMLRVQPIPGAEGTQVLRLPGLIEFVKLSNFLPPVSEPIDFAYAEAFIEGPIVHMHDIGAESESVLIKGSGTMTLPDLALDLSFTTVVVQDLPLITELFERVRNELVTARITGTLYDPKVEVEQLTATRKLLDAIIRGDNPPARP